MKDKINGCMHVMFGTLASQQITNQLKFTKLKFFSKFTTSVAKFMCCFKFLYLCQYSYIVQLEHSVQHVTHFNTLMELLECIPSSVFANIIFRVPYYPHAETLVCILTQCNPSTLQRIQY